MNPFVWYTYLAQLPRSDAGFLADFRSAAAVDQRDEPLASKSTAVPGREQMLRLVLDVAASMTGTWLELRPMTRHQSLQHD